VPSLIQSLAIGSSLRIAPAVVLVVRN
jgi:hypothetical protein